MSAIDTYVEEIREAVWAADVRDAIANGIELCYEALTQEEIDDLIGLLD